MVSQASEIHEELDRVLESTQLKDSAALKALLRYVVEQTLAGHPDGLKEYALGRAVFHRPPDYDPRTDAIVRVQASLLRKKLAAYYDSEAGRNAIICIDLPRGGYVPEFRRPAVALLPTVPTPVVEPARPFAWKAFAMGAIAMACLFAGLWSLTSRPSPAPQAPPTGRSLWAGFFEPVRPVIVSVGIPLFFNGSDGIYVRDVQINRADAPLTPALRALETQLGVRLRIHEDVYTGVGEALGLARISRWLDKHQLTVETANSHYLGQSDLQGKNLVVISSMRFQTLLNQMRLPDAFAFQPEGSGSILNRFPLPGEPAAYTPKASGLNVQTVYAILSVYPGSSAGTRILHLGGMHSWSTDGAAQFSIDPAHLRDLDRRLASDPENGPRGKKSQFLQVLLEVEGKHDQVRHVAYVTHRYLATRTNDKQP